MKFGGLTRQSGCCRFISADLHRVDLRVPLPHDCKADLRGLGLFSDPAMQQEFYEMPSQQIVDAQTAALQYSSDELHLQKMEVFADFCNKETKKMVDDGLARAQSDVNAVTAAKTKAKELMSAALSSIARAQKARIDEAAAEYRQEVSALEGARLIKLVNSKQQFVQAELERARGQARDMPFGFSAEAKDWVQRGFVYKTADATPRFWQAVHGVAPLQEPPADPMQQDGAAPDPEATRQQQQPQQPQQQQ